MRWVGPFATANVAAMEMAGLGCLLVLAAVWCFRRRTDKKRFIYISIGCGIGAAAAFILLIGTGSRAGTLAALVCLPLLSLLHHAPWRLTLLIQALLITGTLLAPFQNRYIGISSDSSALFRITLATRALSMIHDYPLGLGKKAQEIFLNWYMPPSDEGYAIGTTLNEATTCAIRHGIPVLAVGITLLSTVLCIGVQYSRCGHVLPSAGLVILTTHIISGQFQAHLFSNSSLIVYMWGLSIMLCLWGNPRLLDKRHILFCAATMLLCTTALIPLGALIGDSKWSTHMLGGHLFAQPSNEDINGIIVIVNNEQISTQALNRFRDICHAHQQALLWCRDMPETKLLQDLRQQGKINISIIASAQDADKVWSAWRAGKTGPIRVIISDPEHIPSGNKTPHAGELVLVLAKFGLQQNQESIINTAAADGVSSPVILRTLNASWWAQPQALLELHQDTEIQ